MGLDPITLGLAMGGASLASSLMGGAAAGSQKRANAAAQEAQAAQLREQAKLQSQQGQAEAEALDRQRQQLRRRYDQAQGANRMALGTGNVDLASGSALAVADGNAAAFASDMGENAYQRAIREVETRNQVNAAYHQADLLDGNASYQKRAASSLAPTLLGSLLQGAGGFMTGYSFGGRLAGGRK